ncbi:radical SAM protein [Vibrio parahaemolyticus]
MKVLSVYVKPTNFCNIDCDHCYLPEEVRANKKTISFDELRKAYGFVKDVALREKFDDIHFIWHGGEPMMLEPDWYEEAHKIADEVFGEREYGTSIQTSLIRYSSKWDGLINDRWDAFVGSSIDFSARTIRSSTDSYIDLWMKRVNKAREAGITVIPGFVPSKNEIGKEKEIVSWFVENGFEAFNFERYTNFLNKPDFNYPSNKEHSLFMINLFDELMRMMEEEGSAPDVKPIYAAIRGVKDKVSGDRWGTNCQSSFIVIEPNGDINTCPDRSSVEKPFSNFKDGADAFLNSKSRRKWIRMSVVKHKGEHCLNCEYNTWCQSGCPINPNKPFDPKVADCSGHKLFLNHVKQFLNSEKGEIAVKYIS